MSKFKVGDRVSIRTDSEYADQIADAGDNKGTITADSVSEGVVWFHVEFPNSYSNNYRERDLCLARKPKAETINEWV